MALPLIPVLGLLTQGARVLATKIATSPAARKKAQDIIVKNIKKSTDRAKIPTVDSLKKGLSSKQQGLLDDFATAQPKPPVKLTGTAQTMARLENQRQAAIAAEAARNARVSNIVKGVSLSTLPLGLLVNSFRGQEQPVVTEPIIQEQPVIPQPRLMQVINPDVDATGREVLNAALLRAGLSLLRGDTIEDSLRRGISVTKAQNTFNTGEQALAAGRRNLGERATISVQQNADGTFRYAGREEPDLFTTVDNSIKQASKKVITQDIINRVKAMPQNSTLTDEEIIEGLKERGYVEEE